MKLYARYCQRFIVPFLLFLVLAAPGFAAPVELSLDDSIGLAIENNPRMKMAENGREEAKWAFRHAQSLKNMSLVFEHNQIRTDQPPSWDFIDQLSPVPSYNYFSNQLSLILPVYTGGKLESLSEQANLGQQVSALNVEAVKQQIKLETTLNYFSVLQAHNLLDIAKQTVDDFTDHLQNIQSKFDAGVVPLPDLLQTKVKLANAQDGLIKARNNYDLAVYRLNNVMGLPTRGEIKLKGNFQYQPYTLSLDQCIHEALINRPEMSESKMTIQMKQEAVKMARSGNLPTISVFGNNIWDANNSPGGKNSKWMIGMNISMDVYDSGRTATQIQAAKYSVLTAQDQAEKMGDDISLEVSEAYLNMKEAEKRLETNSVAVDQADVDLKLSKQRYYAGVGTNLDVMDAELALNQAKTNYIQALYDYNTSRAQLNKAMGVKSK